jgi:hypothetical protein
VWARLRFAAALIERGKAAEAFPVLDACVEDAEDAGDEDPELLPFALYWRGSCAWDLDNYELARADTERGVLLARGVGLRAIELSRERNEALAGIRRPWPWFGTLTVACTWLRPFQLPAIQSERQAHCAIRDCV